VSTVIERPRIIAEPSSIRGAYEILTPGALELLMQLHDRFDRGRKDLLDARVDRQAHFDAGELPDFAAETRDVRETEWTIGGIPADLENRQVEITGPTNAKMLINALNSGAKVFMADFEDATSPTWDELIQGQLNLRNYWQDRLSFTDSSSGKHYEVGDTPAVLMVRPRGLHLPEKHATVSGEPVAGAFFDFALYFWNNACAALTKGSGPYFYIPKLESRHEAALWSEIFAFAEAKLRLKRGTIKCTVLIETLPAAFEMDEILHALRENIVGLNCGRWDYIFSYIKRLGRSPDRLTPDRSLMTMDKSFLAAYSLRLVSTCHRRGAFAMGGMAAFIPNRRDPEVTENALAKVHEDKSREAGDGFDGTWVAHPDLVPTAMEEFDQVLGDRPNQISRQRPEVSVTAEQLLAVSDTPGDVTEAGIRQNVSVGIQYLASWLNGTGAAAIYNLMEDVATAEISRSQLWQWIHSGARLSDGRAVTLELYRAVRTEELGKLGGPASGRLGQAVEILDGLVESKEFVEFLTLPAYRHLE
jgi:malate synthase